MRIGQFAELAGTSAKTVRFYEQVGLLPKPRRASNGYRDYGDHDVERLAFIRRAQQLGLSLDDIGEVLAFRDHGETPCRRVVELAEHHLEDVDRRIRELIDIRGELRALLDRAQTSGPRPGSYCSLIAPHEP